MQVEVFILKYIDVRSTAADPEGFDPVVRITQCIVIRDSCFVRGLEHVEKTANLKRNSSKKGPEIKEN